MEYSKSAHIYVAVVAAANLSIFAIANASGQSADFSTQKSVKFCWRLAAIAALISFWGFSLPQLAAAQSEGTPNSEIYEPLAADSSNFSALVREAAEVREALTGFANNQAHIVIEFTEPLTAEYNAVLQGLGVYTLSQLSSNGWIASVDEAAASRLVGEQGVQRLRLYSGEEKFLPHDLYDWQNRAGGYAAYSVLFHDDIVANEVMRLSDTTFVSGFESFDALAFPIVSTATLIIDPENLYTLAMADIVLWIEPELPEPIPTNEALVQPLSNVDDVQNGPGNLSGSGVSVGVWEAFERETIAGVTTRSAVTRDTHSSFSGRVSLANDPCPPFLLACRSTPFSDHATHVTGTIISDSTGTAATEGMAPRASAVGYNSHNDANEMARAANSPGAAGQPKPIHISNHSYGIGLGWRDCTSTGCTDYQNSGGFQFGSYRNISIEFDKVAWAEKGLHIFKAAGNDRIDQWDTSSTLPRPSNIGRDCTQNGFGFDANCLGPRAVAKNIITVGAMNGANDVASFSSFGPTADGRIKPDIMAQGVDVMSLNKSSDNGTEPMSGTSMATPAAAGIAALILEEAANLGRTIRPEGMKALLLQTARDVIADQNQLVPVAPGPDYATGYGIADAKAAIELLRRPGGTGLVQNRLTATGNAGAYEQRFVVPPGQQELHVTLAWTDYPNRQLAGGGFRGKVLRNDLDLRLIAPDGSAPKMPWRLDPNSPATPADRNGHDDTINNVEQVSVLNPPPGEWIARISAKPTALTHGPQNFAIAGPLTPPPPVIVGPKRPACPKCIIAEHCPKVENVIAGKLNKIPYIAGRPKRYKPRLDRFRFAQAWMDNNKQYTTRFLRAEVRFGAGAAVSPVPGEVQVQCHYLTSLVDLAGNAIEIIVQDRETNAAKVAESVHIVSTPPWSKYYQRTAPSEYVCRHRQDTCAF